jgi:GntR family transcriptional regulator/MocR family aminotransferase
VVVEVYEQLTAEGWLVSRAGSGTSVAARPPAGSEPAAARPSEPPRLAALDLRPARPDVTAFPRTDWVAATRRVLADLPHEDLSYGDQRGHPRARAIVAAYLARVRGVRTSPDRTLLTEGFSAGLSAVAATLATLGVARLGVEDPGGYEPRGVAAAAGLAPVPIPVDDQGLRVDVLERSDVRAVMVTPAHQYPLGAVLSPERRHQLVAWARATDGWIIEDDYDAEFRYDRAPVGAVQALAPDRTIHLGSVGKTLAPAIRVGWAVVPAALLEPVVTTRHVRASQPATLDHLVVAQLIDEGRYDRHLRGLRRRYRTRRDLVLEVLAEAGLADRVSGIAAGLHAVVRTHDPDDAALADTLCDRGVQAVALGRYAMESDARGLVLGYAQPTTSQLRAALEVIADVLTTG